jgi:hypothetical protein
MAKARWFPSADQEATIRTMVAAGESAEAIARAVEISSPPLKRWLAENDLKITWVFTRVKPGNHQSLAIPRSQYDQEPKKWVPPAQRFKYY